MRSEPKESTKLYLGILIIGLLFDVLMVLWFAEII